MLFRKVCPRQKKGHTHTHTIRFYFFNFFFFIVKAKKLCILMGHLATTSVWKRTYDNDVEKKRKALFCLLFHKTAKTNGQESGCKDVVTALLLVYNCYISFKLLFHLNYPARNSDISNNSDILFVKLICNYFGFKPSEISKPCKIIKIADVIQIQMATLSLLIFFDCFRRFESKIVTN